MLTLDVHVCVHAIGMRKQALRVLRRARRLQDTITVSCRTDDWREERAAILHSLALTAACVGDGTVEVRCTVPKDSDALFSDVFLRPFFVLSCAIITSVICSLLVHVERVASAHVEHLRLSANVYTIALSLLASFHDAVHLCAPPTCKRYCRLT